MLSLFRGAEMILKNCTSPETAYVVEDYPYGFKLRCKIRYWLEYKPNKGYRFCTQTLNPKTLKWNKPKLSVYSDFMVLVKDEVTGYISYDSLHISDSVDKFNKFLVSHVLDLQKDQQIIYDILVENRNKLDSNE